jgi:S1-C subfamily serine protease
LTVDIDVNFISKTTYWPGRLVWLAPACLGLGLGTASAPAATGEAPDIRRDATVMATEQVMPSVVNIATSNTVPVRDPLQQLYRQFWHLRPYDVYYSLGSGVVIDEAGYLLTNDHVVRRANQIAVRFGTGTNDYEATLVASDPNTDIALLKIKARPGEKFHAIKLAPEDDLLLGETVLALGNPLGRLGGSVTRGILSSKSRSAPVEGEPLNYLNWLQTDAPINVGNSGGPLVNLRGELIGINVAVVREAQGEPVEGIGFAIPIRLVEQALADIFPTDFVKSYWFGARVKVGTAPLLITTVEPGSPAGRAGLKAGDLVVGVNGTMPRSFIDFANLLAANANSDVSLTVQRGGTRDGFAVKLLPEKSVFNARMVKEKLGLELEELTAQEVVARYRISTPGALLVSGVEKGSPAAAANLQSGMLLLGLDDQSTSDITALAKLIHAKKQAEAVQLDLAGWQRIGDLNVLRPFVCNLVPR